MTTYIRKSEVKASLSQFVQRSIEEGILVGKLPQEFIDLIKHNFCAKFVHYNKYKKTIEIGIKETKNPSLYPVIKVYSYPVNEAAKILQDSYKENDGDLEFYGTILNRSGGFSSSQVVVF